MAGVASAAVAGASGTVYANDADPRPEPIAGTIPNSNVRSAIVNAWPDFEDPFKVETGVWITHRNGWISEPEECGLYNLLDSTTQRFIIDGQEFVFDGVDDWEFNDPCPEMDVSCCANFKFTTPPKPKGTTYEFKWEVDFHDDVPDHLDGVFPTSNVIEVV